MKNPQFGVCKNMGGVCNKVKNGVCKLWRGVCKLWRGVCKLWDGVCNGNKEDNGFRVTSESIYMETETFYCLKDIVCLYSEVN